MDSRWGSCADRWKTIGGERVELYTDGWKGRRYILKDLSINEDWRSLLLILPVKIN